jgi:hypothetical protein
MAVAQMRLDMRATKKDRIDPTVAFERFERAVAHIIRVPKEKVIQLEKKNGHSRNGRNGKNGKQ